MTIKATVNPVFIVNGQEYGSPEDMPENIRQAYEKILMNLLGSDGSIGQAMSNSKIAFNGEEFASVDSMPAYVRQIYENMLPVDNTISGQRAGALQTSPKGDCSLNSTTLGESIEPRSPVFSSWPWLVISVIIIALLAGLCFMHLTHSRQKHNASHKLLQNWAVTTSQPGAI